LENGKWKMENGSIDKGLMCAFEGIFNLCLCVGEAGTNVGYRRNRKESRVVLLGSRYNLANGKLAHRVFIVS
jgi:hypothetical protein